jgi:hypothetical protein
MGAMIGLVMVILMVMALMGFSSNLTTSTTGRTYKRVLDIRSAIEAGESAIGEAVTAVRKSMDTGATTPECGDDWRTLLLNELQNPGTLSRNKKVVPKESRDTFAKQGLVVSDVTVHVIDLFLAQPAPGQSILELELPQGVLEFAVEVGGAQRIMNVKKSIRQRRCFYVWVDPSTASPTGDLDPAKSLFYLLSNPLGTVIDQP